ncbi:hypothetical protein SGPA1_21239 [Streptomyces misionensis JCM 4497]
MDRPQAVGRRQRTGGTGRDGRPRGLRAGRRPGAPGERLPEGADGTGRRVTGARRPPLSARCRR